MSKEDVPEAAPSGGEDPADAAPDQESDAKHHEPFIPPGTEATRELREQSRRRREAEEKLQQHLREAKDKPAEH